ncbi:MAG: hypothetical protein ACK5O2_05775, partial [Microthrixaceae bacterium]
MQRRLEASQVKRLVEGSEQGATLAELAGWFGVHQRTVSAHLDRRGTARRSSTWDDATLRRAAQAY